MCLGLPDKTGEDADKIVSELVNKQIDGALILDPDKVGEVATKVALKTSEGRSKVKVLPDLDEIVELAKECTECEWCDRVCPNSISMMDAVMAASKDDLSQMQRLYDNDIC